MPNPPNKLHIPTGTIFGKLTVLSEVKVKSGSELVRGFNCQCSCGNTKI